MTPTAKLAAMRRGLLIFLLALLPLQLTWAAVSTYCQHESSSSGQHLGHHVHKHSYEQSGSDSTSSAERLTVENDCGVCHANCTVALQSSMPPLNRSVSPRWFDADPALFSTSYHDTPDRPRWISLAS